MIINRNIPAIQAYNALTATNSALQKSIQKLSTGLRINSAADDAAGLAISEKMRAQIKGLDRAAANSQDGISMIQTAEGALSETHSILQRMRELSVQAANDTLTQEDRSYIQLEVDQLKEEISRIASTTQFNRKKLLDGSAAALWSSDQLTTKAIVNGGLRQTDQFGQKAAVEGNFRITVNASPGQAEIQKSDIFKIKHKNVIMNLSMNREAGVENVEVDNLPAGRYNVTLDGASGSALAVSQAFGVDSTALSTAAASDDQNASILLEVTKVNSSSGTVTFRVQANLLGVDGTISSFTVSELLVNDQGIVGAAGTNTYTALGLAWTDTTLTISDYSKFHEGNKLVLNQTADTGATIDVVVSATINQTWPYAWKDGGIAAKYGVAQSDIAGSDVQFKNFYLNTANGTVYQGNIILSLNSDFATKASAGDTLASFEAAYIGQVAKGDVKLRDLDKFWDANGKFMLDDPKRLTVYQGDGKQTSVTLYATDTLNDVRSKLNDAIAGGLGQAQYITSGNAPEFVSYVNGDPLDAANYNMSASGPMSVAGTMVIRSVVAGAAGRISFSGDEDLIKALSLNVIQEAREISFTVSVADAHSAKGVADSVKITGNVLYGIVNPNVDVEFDKMANIAVTWDADNMKFILSKESGSYETVIHLADNTTVFQIGANEGEDMGVNIGDMSAASLGVLNVLVTDRESAARGITMIDNAISKVSTQRAKLGAYQNRLEHTINNLTTASTNTTAAESRIRDADMAKEMMEFTKLNILSQAGNSMLAQANALPQNVLALLR